MAPRAPKKTKLRRADHRRIEQVQRLVHKEVQAVEALADHIRKAMDTYRNSSPKWADGPVRANVYIRSGEVLRTLHYSLQKRVLHPKRVRGVQLDPKAGRVRANNGKNKSLGFAVVSGGVPPDARLRLPIDFRVDPIRDDETVQEHGGRIHCHNCDD